MAVLNDLIVSGASRLAGPVKANSIQMDILKAPTTSGGATYGPGTNGQVLKSNGSTVYWGTDAGYTHPTFTTYASGLYKVTVNNQGHVTAAIAVTKADITGLGVPGSDTNTTYTFASGSTNGAFTVTPSGGSAQSVAIYGLKSAAYKDAVSTNTASTVVLRDSNGNFSAGTITATLSGNAATASALKGATSSSVPLSNGGAGYVSYVYNVISNTAGNPPDSNNANGVLTFNTHSGNYYHQLAFSSNNNLYHRAVNGTALTTSTGWNRIMTSNQAIPYIVGPTTDTTAGTWTGTCEDITAYVDGLTIIYVPKVAGASTTTLNINGLGAKTCYYTNSSKLTTHFSVNTPIMLTYIGGTWKRADYDSNTNTQIRVYRQTSGYNGDYPILVSRTALNSIGTAGTNSSYTLVYGVIGQDGAKTPTINPHTGVITAPGGFSGGVKDYNNGTLTKFGYSTSGMAQSAATWLGAWDATVSGEYRLRAVKQADLRVAYAESATKDGSDNVITSYYMPKGYWNWSGQSGQPTWLWGGNSANTYYVYNPSNFNVNSATKWTTARTITIKGDMQGSVSIDGSANKDLIITNYSCSVGSNNTSSYPYHRIAYITNKSSTHSDADCILDIRKNYDNASFGRIKISFRTNSSGAAVSCNARWIYRSGFAADDVTIAWWGVTGNACYADVFLKVGTWARTSVYQPYGSRSWTLVSSSEGTDGANPTEAYATVAAAGTALHSQAYTATASATDTGIVNYANSAGSIAWSDITGKPSTYTPASHNHDSLYLKLTGGSLSGRLTINSTNNTASPTGQSLVLNGVTGSTDIALAPGIGFHIGSITWGSLKFVSSGHFALYNSDCSEYMPIVCSAATATNMTAQYYNSPSSTALYVQSSSTLYLKSAASTSLIFMPQGVEKARFDTSGNFKISTVTYNSTTVDNSTAAHRNIKIIPPSTVVTVGSTAIPTGEVWLQYQE